MALLAFGIFATHDVVIKYLGGSYTPFQIVFFSVLFGFPIVTFVLLRDATEANLIPKHPWWTALRTLAAVVTGFCAFYAFSVLPLAQTYAILFAAPLLITLLAIPVLGERVGVHRLSALLIGFIGVGVMMIPASDWGAVPRGALFLPIVAAACYAGMQVMTRKLGAKSTASAMALYIQFAFIAISAVFWVMVGDGRLAGRVENESLVFLLRAWIWPAATWAWASRRDWLRLKAAGRCPGFR